MKFSCIVTIKDKLISITSEGEYPSKEAFENAVKQKFLEKYREIIEKTCFRISHTKVV